MSNTTNESYRFEVVVYADAYSKGDNSCVLLREELRARVIRSRTRVVAPTYSCQLAWPNLDSAYAISVVPNGYCAPVYRFLADVVAWARRGCPTEAYDYLQSNAQRMPSDAQTYFQHVAAGEMAYVPVVRVYDDPADWCPIFAACTGWRGATPAVGHTREESELHPYYTHDFGLCRSIISGAKLFCAQIHKHYATKKQEYGLEVGLDAD